MIKKFNVPKRIHATGAKKMVSWRLPEGLIDKLNDVSDRWGWTTTELVVTALDQFLEYADNEDVKEKGDG